MRASPRYVPIRYEVQIAPRELETNDENDNPIMFEARRLRDFVVRLRVCHGRCPLVVCHASEETSTARVLRHRPSVVRPGSLDGPRSWPDVSKPTTGDRRQGPAANEGWRQFTFTRFPELLESWRRG